MRWYYIKSAKLVVRREGKDIKVLNLEEVKKLYPQILPKIVVENLEE